jgi:glycosyltransferase involved in cell wall biosynthesis
MAVEAQFCGTPVISTDFGAFRETVEEGRTGMRCHYIGDFVRACKFTPKLVNAEYIRERACKLYSLEAAAVKYRRYFDRLEMLWDKGWETV